ncbi:MAG TPA: HAMP domain-containing sensor histidine kinase [Pilimelia sp.]|nr:HAMP domain-containing sensor histidine kinase [Pilimelia sp.]
MAAYVNRALDLLPRPLDPVRSIKIKLGLLLVGAGFAGLVVFWRGIGWIPYYTSATAIGVALLTSYVLAHGMTSPLREMTAAARAMARGDYSRRVRATSRDEVGELASAFNTMAAELAAADRQRRELIANVSHELRTPITALQGLLENIVDGVAEPDPATLSTALRQTERLGRLVDELLDLSRLDAGVAPLDKIDLDVVEFLADAVREARVVAAGSGREVRFRVRAAAAPVRLRADPERLHQVMANLLDNAARHSPAGGSVTVATRRSGGRVLIDVTDEGTGIPPEQRTRVFERFTRGDRAVGLDGGTGLGLAISRWIVELHDGTIAVADPRDEPAGSGPGNPAGPARSGTHRPVGCRLRIALPDPDAAPPA